MNLALYRKYRPSRFEDVVGQDDVVLALRNQLKTGKLGHAYIFTGIRGTGKTTLAKILAKAVNCPNAIDGEPCGTCDICRGIDDGSVLDVTEMDAASNNRVDDVRDLLDETHYSPVLCKMRVYIVDEVHMMTSSAFNALLKTIEEPPAHVMFIFATTEINKVPVTIRSRCQRFDLKRIPEKAIAERLMYVAEKENIPLQMDAASLIARLADGALRDALTLLETAASFNDTIDSDTVKKVSGLTDKSYLFKISSMITEGDCSGLLQLLKQLYADGADAKKLLNELIRHYRDILMVGSGDVSLTDCSEETQRMYKEESEKRSVESVLHTMQVLADSADRMNRSLDSDVSFELAVLKLAGEKGIYTAPTPVQAQKNTAPVAVKSFEAKSETVKPAIKETPDEPTEKKAPAEEVTLTFSADVNPASPEAWSLTLNIIKQKSIRLWAVLKDSKAHLDDKYLLIEAGDLAYTYLRENAESRQIIKDAFQSITGVLRGIGPWKGDEADQQSDDGLTDLLNKAGAEGVSITTVKEISE